MLGENFADVVVALVEEVLLVVIRHPLRQNCATAADNSSDAFGNHRQILDQHTGVNGHIIHTLLSLLFNHFKHHAGGKVFNPLHSRNSFINWHSADRYRRMPQNGLTNFVNVSTSR